jgi:hypothetical protein
MSSSATSATYTPPSAATVNADCTATVTATSATDSSKQGSVALTIKAIAVNLTSPPSNTTLGEGASSVTLTAALANEAAGANDSVVWSLSAIGGNAVGGHQKLQVQSSTCGTLTPNGASATYTPPASQASDCTATIVAASTINPNQKATIAFTVKQIVVAITAPATAVTQFADNGSVLLTATLTNDGAAKGLTWSLSPVSGCGTIAANGLSATYAPPAAPATQCAAAITATSVTDPAKTVNAPLITINPIIAVGFSPAPPSGVSEGSTTALSATITNDLANGGLSWSLSPTTGCGSLSAGAGTSVTFTAPSVMTAACSATVTVTSVADHRKTVSSSIAINQTSVSITQPGGNQNIAAGTGFSLAASITDDGTGQGVKWAISPASGCGSLAASSGLTNTYTGPVETGLASACTATITASSAADSGKTASLQVTANPISVTLSPSSAQTLKPTQILPLTGTLSHDPTNSGLSWSISPASGCGSLSANSGTAVNYTAPATLASQCTATVSVASVADNTRTASVALTVNPISVSLTPAGPLTLGEGAAAKNFSVIVNNDLSNQGVSWTLNPVGGCGTLSASTSTSVDYNAPTSLVSVCNATLTATSLADNTKSASAQITINPITLGITPNTSQSLFAGETLPLSATITNDGGANGVSWALNPVTGCGSLSSNTGTAVTYTAPVVLASTCSVTVTASSVTDNTKTAQVGVTVSPAIVVSLSPNTAQSVWAGGTLQVTPTVSNDSANKGVNLSLNPATGCGTLSGTSNVSSGTPVTYTAPASLSSQCSVTLTAVSISDGTKQATLGITSKPTISVSLNPGTPQALNAGNTLSITPTITNDITNAGANLVLNPSTGCGSLSVATATSGTPFTYTAPTSLGSSCAATVTMTSIADNTKSASLNITVNPAIVVTLSPNVAQNIDANTTLQITPTVLNDGAAKGVSFALNPTTGCGSISPMTNVASGTATTYTAPTSLSSVCSVTVTATSITDNTKSASLDIAVNLPLILPSPNPNSLGPAIVGGSYQGSINVAGGLSSYSFSVNGSPVATNGTPFAISNGLSATSTGGNTLTISGTPTTATTVSFQVSVKDATGAVAGPFTYSVVANNPTPLTLPSPNPQSLGSGVVGSAYGGAINASGGIPGYTFTLNGTAVPTNGSLVAISNGLSASNTSGNTLQISGTPTSATTVTFQVSVKDSVNTTAGPITYSINLVNPTPLQINTTQQDISNGLVGSPYQSYIDVTGGSGNNGNYVFSVSSGSLPPGVNLGSGNCNSCIVGTPTTAGSNNFTIKVTDSTIPGSQATASYTVTVSNGPDGTKNYLLYGRYAFLFRGFVDGNNGNAQYQTASIGSFVADGAGNINNVQFDVNDGSGAAFQSYASGITGTYSMGPDNRGIVKLSHCVTSKGCYSGANEFTISMGEIVNVSLTSGTCPNSGSNASCPVYTNGRMVEFDDVGTTATGVHGDAELFRQSVGQFNTLSSFETNVAGSWVFGNRGEDTSHGPLVAAGTFSAQSGTFSGSNLNGTINTGMVDINDAGTDSTSLTLLGTDTYTASTGAIGSNSGATTTTGGFAGTLNFNGPPLGYPTNYVFYMIDANRMVAMSWDSHAQSSLVSGILYKQQSSHTTMPASAVMYMTGSGGTSYGQLLQATCAGTTCTVNTDDVNDSGTYTQNQNPPAGTPFSVSVTSNGRVTLSGAGNHPPVFYLYDSTATGGAVMLNTGGGTSIGEMRAQGTVPGTVSGLANTTWGYYMGNVFTMYDSGTSTGAFTVSNTGAMSGYSDDGGQGYTSYGSSFTGFNLTAPNSYGVFHVQAGGQNQVVCYLVRPSCSGGGTTCGTSSNPYASFACLDTGSNNPKITIVQQVQ